MNLIHEIQKEVSKFCKHKKMIKIRQMLASFIMFTFRSLVLPLPRVLEKKNEIVKYLVPTDTKRLTDNTLGHMQQTVNIENTNF